MFRHNDSSHAPSRNPHSIDEAEKRAMYILKAVLAAIAAFAVVVLVGTFCAMFMTPQLAYQTGRIGAYLYLAVAIIVFFYALKRFKPKDNTSSNSTKLDS